MSACVKPVSWLLLERYQIGEVSAAERRQVEAHLETCTGCQADLDKLVSDDRPLPALPQPEPARPRWSWTLAGVSAAAAAIALVVGLWAPWRPPAPSAIPPARIQIKGGELALTLIREREGVITQNPTRFAAGDRFRIELTCPPGRTNWDVVVFQADQAYFPYAAAGPVTCGNRVGLPGAFSLTGSGPVTVCATVGDVLPPRVDVVGMTFEALAERSVCQSLRARRD